jgi:hypothetical protein
MTHEIVPGTYKCAQGNKEYDFTVTDINHNSLGELFVTDMELETCGRDCPNDCRVRELKQLIRDNMRELQGPNN